MSPRFPSVMLLVMATTLLAGQAKSSGQKKAFASQIAPAATSIFTITATPSSISFSATDPDLVTFSGSSAASVQFEIRGGATNKNWSLTVAAGGSTFTGCTTIPASAVKATCSSATVVNVSGTTGTAACSAGAALSTTPTTVATGAEGSQKDDYTITITFLLTDAWSYIAKTSPTCPLTLTYSLNAA